LRQHELLLDPGNHISARGPAQHEGNTRDGFTFGVARDGALPDLGADRYGCQVAQPNGNSIAIGHDGLAEVLDIPDPAVSPHDELLPRPFHISPAGNAVVRGHGLGKLIDRESVAAQGRWLSNDLELTHLAAEGIDTGRSGHRLQDRSQDPVLQCPQLHQAPFGTFEGVLEDLTQTRGNRTTVTIDSPNLERERTCVE
jgi:hypothetical protein